MEREKVIKLINAELRLAEKKHPVWPIDTIHAVGIITEKLGESMQAAIDYTYANGDIEHLQHELLQTGAMVIRALIFLDKDD